MTSEKTDKPRRRIIEIAEAAKAFIASSDEEPLPDEIVTRAAIAFDQLRRAGEEPGHYLQGLGKLGAFERSFVVAMIAGNFADYPPSTPHRAALFATELRDEVGATPSPASVGQRLASLQQAVRDVLDWIMEAFDRRASNNVIDDVLNQACDRLKALDLGSSADEDDGPVVCGGCHAVGPEPHAADCIDERIRIDQEERRERGEFYDPTDDLGDGADA